MDPTIDSRIKTLDAGILLLQTKYDVKTTKYNSSSQGMFTPWTMKSSKGHVRFVIGC